MLDIILFFLFSCVMQVEEELARAQDDSAKLENSVRDLTSLCNNSSQQIEELRKELKEKVSDYRFIYSNP